MLIGRKPEHPLVHLCNLTKTSLELFTGLILNAAVLDEHREVMLAVESFAPPELVDVLVEFVRPRRRDLVAEELLHLCFEVVETHSIDGVF